MQEDARAYCATTNIAFFELPKLVSLGIRLVHLTQGDIHEVVTVDEVAVERLAVLKFDQLQK
jgi:hypothetical protein